MKPIKDVIPKMDNRNKETVKCTNCGQEHEHYDVYIGDEFQTRINNKLCFYCNKKKEEQELRDEAMRKRRVMKLKRFKDYSEIPLDMELATFENYQPENQTQAAAKDITLKFSNEEYEKTTLFFQGDTGLGKTHLSYSAYRQFIKNEKGAIFIDLPSLLSDIRATYNNDKYDYRAKTQESIMKAINDCELLVLDDIGAEYVKPDANGYESWAADILFQIVNSRQRKKNIYTTNFTSKHLTKKYGMLSKRIISRLMNNAKVIKIEGDDHRLKGLE